MDVQEITQEMWDEWRINPVTRQVFKAISEERDAVRDSIPRLDPNNQSELIGRIMRLSALEDLLDIDLGGEE